MNDSKALFDYLEERCARGELTKTVNGGEENLTYQNTGKNIHNGQCNRYIHTYYENGEVITVIDVTRGIYPQFVSWTCMRHYEGEILPEVFEWANKD
ncbi:hypothetical protein [Flagellimonas meridianipacifica]|uniref:Uncharacterized protein n=1 Tax=Flagellimonas meridianipacifica TaxID=1080225 RepID=A0A2T0MAB7_9FLAO|nr:hypothetical protein [Allomuricauda pacifica]PRX54405.1 hypothetical protein CLV81_2806 [Allomuricauda pacifica]